MTMAYVTPSAMKLQCQYHELGTKVYSGSWHVYLEWNSKRYSVGPSRRIGPAP